MPSLVRRVRGALSELCDRVDEPDWQDADWTREVKQAIVRLAADAGQPVYASGTHGVAGGEWLYDLTWLDYSPEARFLKRTILVLESEWDRDLAAIEEDFDNLLLARADLRVMVFQAKSAAEVQTVANRLVAIINACEQTESGDQYLLAGWMADCREFEHCEYTHGAP